MIQLLIGCCGLDCSRCDARIATVENNDQLREQTAKKWSEMNNAPQITAQTINCMGCRTQGVKFAYCSDYCQIRKCVYTKGFNTCAECAKFDDCPVVAPIFEHAPEAKANLKQL